MELILLAITAAVFFFAPVDKMATTACLVSYNGECVYADTTHELMSLVETDRFISKSNSCQKP